MTGDTHVPREDTLGPPTDASLEAMPNAPPKRFLPRLHIQYQTLGAHLGSIEFRFLMEPSPSAISRGSQMLQFFVGKPPRNIRSIWSQMAPKS